MTLVDTPADELEANLRRNVRLLLAFREMTMTELAHTIGVSLATMSQKMTGARRFTVPELVRMCEVFNVAPMAMVQRVDPGFQNWKFLRVPTTATQARHLKVA